MDTIQPAIVTSPIESKGEAVFVAALPAAQRGRAIWLIAAIVIGICVVAVYAAGAWHNELVYDDHEVIENQFPIHSFHDIRSIFTEPHYLNFPYYRPITRLTFAIQKTIWGNDPLPYHLFNAILAGLVMLAGYGLLRQNGLLLPPAAALLVAAWLGFHPAISECVYPAASGRETLLATFIILLAAAAYLRAEEYWHWIAVLLLAVGVLCKEQAVVLPGIFLLIEIIRPNSGHLSPLAVFRERISVRTKGESAPEKPSPQPSLGVPGAGENGSKPLRWIHFTGQWIAIIAILLAYFQIRRWVFGGPSVHLTILEHPFEPLLSFIYGMQTALTPFMELYYEPRKEIWFDSALSAIAIVTFIILVALVFRASRKVKRLAIFWLGWFVLLQLPTAHIVAQEAAYSERYVALATLAVPALLAAIVLNRWRHISQRILAGSIGIIWVGILAYISFFRGYYYNNDLAFCKQWHNTDLQSAGAYVGLGMIAQQHNEGKLAEQEYEQALKYDFNSRTAHNNLANLYTDANMPSRAAENYVWLLDHDPKDWIALAGYARMLGGIAFADGDPYTRDKSRKMLEEALAIKPDYGHGHYLLGVWDEGFATAAEAIAEYQKVIKLNQNPLDVADSKKRIERLEQQSTHSVSQPESN